MAKKILLADDSITIQKVIELTFSDEDFDVITVGNGRLALERFPEVRPDVVLCDIIMPEKDGYEVCEQIKSNPAWSQVPVLLLTGAFEPFDQERATRAGYDGSLAKPFEPETLIAKVKELLARAPRPAASTPPSQPPRPVGGAISAPPSVLPFSRPAAPEPPPPPAPDFSGGFIPEEPFASFEDESFDTPAEEPQPASPGLPPAPPLDPAATGFASLSDEESTTLATAPDSDTGDSASTVMFRASELPWAVAAPPAAATPPPAAAPGSEPTLMPEAPAEEPEIVEEQGAFEAVLEEDLDFGPNGYAPELHGSDDAAMAAEFGGGIATLPPLPPSEQEGPTGQFAALVRDELEPSVDAGAYGPGSVPLGETVFEPEPEPAAVASEPELPEPAPELVGSPHHEPAFFEVEPEPDTLVPRPAFEEQPQPPELEEDPAATSEVVAPAAAPPPQDAAPAAAVDERTTLMPRPVFDQPETAAAAPVPPPAVVLAPPAPAVSFADVMAPAAEPPAPPPSETASVAVPVDMVEKIAQRVVAQISEKAVREIAWDVIPDLAETLIKQELERLKAELAKL